MKKHKIRNVLLLLLGLLLICTIIWVIWGNTALTVSEFDIESDSIPKSFDGFRIVQISDLHNAEFGSNNQSILEKIRTAQPDMIVITGDLVDCRNTNCDIAIRFAQETVKIAPTYYVPGNHESRISEYPLLESGLTDAGVCILKDSSIDITKNGEKIHLLGLIDPDFRPTQDKTNTHDTLRNLTDSESYNILLAHRPEGFTVYQDCNIDLVFTGHAHGGQFRLPWIGGVYAPGQGLWPEYDAGLYTGGNTNMIVSRGLGNSLFPFRLNNPPEIIVATLKSAK